MKRPLISVLAVISVDDRLVMIRRGTQPFKDKWSLPGGILEFGEELEDAVIREVKEEINISVSVNRLIDFKNTIIDYEGEIHHYLIFYYECAYSKLNIQAGEEILDVAIKHPRELYSELSPAIINFLFSEGYI